MLATYNNIKRVYNLLYKNIATTDNTLSYRRVLDGLILLSELIEGYEDETECMWYLGEYNAFTLDTLIIQSYWHLTEWHEGGNSLSYKALCALGAIFNPGCTDIDCEEDKFCYEMLEGLAENM